MPGHTDRWTAPQSCVLTPLLNKDQDTVCPRHFAEILNDLSSLRSSLTKASPSLWQTGQGTQLPQAQGRSASPGQHFTPARTSPSAAHVWLPQTGVAPSALASSPLYSSPLPVLKTFMPIPTATPLPRWLPHQEALPTSLSPPGFYPTHAKGLQRKKSMGYIWSTCMVCLAHTVSDIFKF